MRRVGVRSKKSSCFLYILMRGSGSNENRVVCYGRPILTTSVICPACICFQPLVLPGLQLASCSLTVPPCPLLGFWFLRPSCRIEQLVVHRGGQLEHVRHFCKALSTPLLHFPCPSLALAPWVRVLNRVFALKRLSDALLSVEPTLTPFIPCLFIFL